jgi:hypothetical protein
LVFWASVREVALEREAVAEVRGAKKSVGRLQQLAAKSLGT